MLYMWELRKDKGMHGQKFLNWVCYGMMTSNWHDDSVSPCRKQHSETGHRVQIMIGNPLQQWHGCLCMIQYIARVQLAVQCHRIQCTCTCMCYDKPYMYMYMYVLQQALHVHVGDVCIRMEVSWGKWNHNYGTIWNSYWPIPEVCMQYGSTNPEGKGGTLSHVI